MPVKLRNVRINGALVALGDDVDGELHEDHSVSVFACGLGGTTLNGTEKRASEAFKDTISRVRGEAMHYSNLVATPTVASVVSVPTAAKAGDWLTLRGEMSR